jgi:tripartite-type tricarboxylate transporter receptor subunit TctC
VEDGAAVNMPPTFRSFMQRRHLLLCAALAVPSVGSQAFAPRSPRPIKLLVAFPAGGPTDITMRSLADNASKSSASR